jgi:hypothetical protein
MDFSDYPVDHPNHSTANKKRIGKFKDEVNGKIISEFIGLKPKMYAMQMDDGIYRLQESQRCTEEYCKEAYQF